MRAEGSGRLYGFDCTRVLCKMGLILGHLGKGGKFSFSEALGSALVTIIYGTQVHQGRGEVHRYST